MEIIFNDIAMHYQFKDKYDAIEKMKIGIETLLYLRKQDTTFKICSQGKITGLEIAPGYYFPQIFSENNSFLSQNYKTAITELGVKQAHELYCLYSPDFKDNLTFSLSLILKL